ncbi:MAG TPA: hypothetical protein VFS16_15795 [Acidimicrobiia bacterium]|nr:hypothetical protein [Acidimicrobiia bacterium]
MSTELYPSGTSPVPALALVHHGHQHLITDGYDNHEGLSEVLDSFGAVLALHLRYRVPLNLHLSGTLLEATAWHAPEFFGWVRALLDEGLVEILGSAYSQPVMTLFGAEHNRRQIAEELAVLQRHLGVEPEALTGFWVPERVWDTPLLGPLLENPELDNGGYRYVLLDDRLAYPLGERADFDRRTAPGRSPQPASAAGPPPPAPPSLNGSADGHDGGNRHLFPWRIAGTERLVALPISGDLRYAIPPRDHAAWRLLLDTVESVRRSGGGGLAVYADDLEKTASVGHWTSGAWRRADVDAYEQLLRWLTTTDQVEAVLLSPWLAEHPLMAERAVDPGTFYELAAGGAGEDYRRWWSSPRYAPYRATLERTQAVLEAGPPAGTNGSRRDPSRRLWNLAWKQLMAATYETAWHGLGAGPEEPAPWARATAAHARAAAHTVAAARFGREVRSPESLKAPEPKVWSADLDEDGQDEVILANEKIFAVLSPRFGGRLVALYDLETGSLVVGNPADDWNWQEELNRYMEVPANHPGALADVDHENECWRLVATRSQADVAEVELRHTEASSQLFGSQKFFRLGRGARHLEVIYRLREAPERFRVEIGLSPDYLTLLQEGRDCVRPVGEGRRLGYAAGEAAVWVELPDDEPVVWEQVPSRSAGHVLLLRVAAYRPSFTLHLGVGDPAPPREIDLRAAVRREVPTSAVKGGKA